MSSWSRTALEMLVDSIQFAAGSHLLDVGGGDGTIARGLCEHFSSISISIMDLPHVCEKTSKVLDRAIVENEIHSSIRDRIGFYPCDFFQDDWPPNTYDYVLFAHQLLIWSESDCVELLERAFEILKPGGEVVIISSMTDESGTGPLPSVMRTAYFLSIPSGEGEVYRWTDYVRWLRQVGFDEAQRIEIDAWTPHGIIVGKKSK